MNTLPPGPSGAIRQSLAYSADPYGYGRSMCRRYGDPYTMPMPMGPIVVCSHPEAVRLMFTAPSDTFDVWAREQLLPVFGEDSIFTLVGAEHKRHRPVVMEACRYRGDMLDVCQAMLTRLVPGQSIALAPFLLNLSLEVILDVVFGLRGDDETRTMLSDYVYASGSTAVTLPLCYPSWRRNLYPPWPRFLRLRDRLRARLSDIVQARRSDTVQRADMLTILGRHFDTKTTVDEVLTLLIAGHESTARSITFTCELLAQHPETMRRVQMEIDSLSEDASLAQISALPFLDAVCDESLRLHPVAVQWSRTLRKPFDVAGYSLPAGISVALSSYLVQRRAEIFAEPDVFRPERFLDKRPGAFEFFPFGGGPTRCPGAALAKDEMKTVLFYLLRRFTLQPKRKQPVRTEVKGLVMAPHDDVVMTLMSR